MDRAKQNNEAAVHSALLENLSDDAISFNVWLCVTKFPTAYIYLTKMYVK